MSCLVSRHRPFYYTTTGSGTFSDNYKFGLHFVTKSVNINVMKTRTARVDFLQPQFVHAGRYDKLEHCVTWPLLENSAEIKKSKFDE